MRFHILTIGRARGHPSEALVRDYLGRLPWSIDLKEFEERRKLSMAEQCLREGELLLKAIPKGALVVALDILGKSFSSAEFARRLGGWLESGPPDLCFMIGGAGGFSEAVKEKADLLLSFGAMTWPHMLARVLLCEQLYRAHTILSGHPYHRA